jgi:hypothetical protein
MMKKAKILITIILGLGFGYFFMFKSNYERLDNPANIPNNLEESFTELDRILPAATRLTISDHSLWITATSFSVGDTLVQLNENEIKIAIYDGKLKFDGEIGDDRSKGNKRQDFISVQAIDRSQDGVLYLAGLSGIFQVQKGVVRPFVRFHFPPGVSVDDYEEGYRRTIAPQQLARFTDGAFLIGDADSGLYRLQKDATGAWQLSLLHQKIGEVVTFEN